MNNKTNNNDNNDNNNNNMKTIIILITMVREEREREPGTGRVHGKAPTPYALDTYRLLIYTFTAARQASCACAVGAISDWNSSFEPAISKAVFRTVSVHVFLGRPRFLIPTGRRSKLFGKNMVPRTGSSAGLRANWPRNSNCDRSSLLLRGCDPDMPRTVWLDTLL